MKRWQREQLERENQINRIWAYLGVGEPAPGPVGRKELLELIDFVQYANLGPFGSLEAHYELEALFLSRAEPAWLHMLFDIVIRDYSLRPLVNDYHDDLPMWFGRFANKYPETGREMFSLLLIDKQYRAFALNALSGYKHPNRDECLASVADQVADFDAIERACWEEAMTTEWEWPPLKQL